MSKENDQEVKSEEQPVELTHFLEAVPPSFLARIATLTEPFYSSPNLEMFLHKLITPEIRLHCPNDSCGGLRFFRCTNDDDIAVPDDKWGYVYLSYVCANCRQSTKTFSLAVQHDSGKSSGQCYKLGELPHYGPPTPPRLIKLIGPDSETFLKGRRCENQGLGIGAFVYYRRVVENQKNRILDEIIKVSHKLNASDTIIKVLEGARAESQFSKAVESVKDALPQALLINGHNPLTLLHSALSDGLHGQSDEHCLERANTVRVILAELSERLAQALKDEVELNNALSRLMKPKIKVEKSQ